MTMANNMNSHLHYARTVVYILNQPLERQVQFKNWLLWQYPMLRSHSWPAEIGVANANVGTAANGAVPVPVPAPAGGSSCNEAQTQQQRQQTDDDNKKMETNKLLHETAARLDNAIAELVTYTNVLSSEQRSTTTAQTNNGKGAIHNISESIIPLLYITSQSIREAGQLLFPIPDLKNEQQTSSTSTDTTLCTTFDCGGATVERNAWSSREGHGESNYPRTTKWQTLYTDGGIGGGEAI
jgi:hypothetical protein